MGAEVTLSQIFERTRGKEFDKQLQTVWTRFFQMIAIPYPKTPAFPHGDASQLMGFFKEYAESNHFSFAVDECQNVCITVAPSAGYENEREVVVQAHHDGVFVGDPDPSNTGITPVLTEDGQWVRGDTSNLTADDRLGLATGLTAVEDLVRSGKSHGPIKILLTAGEDSGLIGAMYLGRTQSPFLNGNQTVINVDSAGGADMMVIGCASGSRDNITIPVKTEPIGTKTLYKYVFSGFPGGHSGGDIGKDRPSSIKFFAELFSQLKQEFPNISLVSVNAGEAFNAIPASASFLLAIDEQDKVKVEEFINAYIEAMKRQIPVDAPDEYKQARMKISASNLPLRDEEQKITQQLDKTTTDLLINLIQDLPHGVGERDGSSILSSLNIGTVQIESGKIIIQTMTRGKETSHRDVLRDKIRTITDKYNLNLEEKMTYPHWSPHPERPLVQLAKEIGQKVLGREIKTRVSQGGLEPGIFERDFPGLESISIASAIIEDEHSLEERANIDSLADGYALCFNLITEVPKAY